MSRFFVFYHASKDAMERMRNMTPEEGMLMKKTWFEWGDKWGDKILELGGPLMNSHKVTPEGSEPFQSDLGSYSLMEADSMEKALSMLDGHPHLSFAEGCTIEIYESMQTPER